jgi:acyl phosphate:glycerol-3-phosphate acyltransferase
MSGVGGFFFFGAYFIGSFPTGVVLSRLRFGIDVRELGSGNIGATNITRNFGWSAGIVTCLADGLKGVAVVYAGKYLLALGPGELVVGALGVVLGHCFSVFLRFRGGKGVATTLGCWLLLAPVEALVLAATYAVVTGATRISAIGSLAGVTLGSLVALFFSSDPYQQYVVYLLSFTVIGCHQANIARMLRGI